MEQNNNHKGFRIATIVLLVLIFLCVSATAGQLERYFGDTEYSDDDEPVLDNINSNIGQMQEQIDELESKLAKQNSILDSYKVKCDDYDLHTLKGNIVAKIRLKKYTDDTKVRLTIGDTTSELKRKGDVFVGKLNMDIIKIYDEITVSVDENGTKSSETVSNISESDENVGDLDWEYYLSEQGKSCNFYQEDEDLTINPGKYEIKIPPKNKLKENPILYIVNSNKEILKKDMSYNEEKADFEAEIDKDIAVKNARDCRVYTQFTLDTGEIVQYNYDSFGDDEDNEDEEQLIYINGKDVQFEYMDENY